MTDPKGRSTKAKSAERQKRRVARKAVEKATGKKLPKGATVHHKDGNRSNNGKGNLQTLSNKTHGALHGRGHKKPTKKVGGRRK